MAITTIDAVIQEVDALEPNALDYAEKVKWLSRFDGQLYERYMKGREGAPAAWKPYAEDTPGDTALLVEHPWDGIYIHWLRAQIALYHGENDLYSDEMALVGQDEKLFADVYAAGHPRAGGNRFRF